MSFILCGQRPLASFIKQRVVGCVQVFNPHLFVIDTHRGQGTRHSLLMDTKQTTCNFLPSRGRNCQKKSFSPWRRPTAPCPPSEHERCGEEWAGPLWTAVLSIHTRLRITRRRAKKKKIARRAWIVNLRWSKGGSWTDRWSSFHWGRSSAAGWWVAWLRKGQYGEKDLWNGLQVISKTSSASFKHYQKKQSRKSSEVMRELSYLYKNHPIMDNLEFSVKLAFFLRV